MSLHEEGSAIHNPIQQLHSLLLEKHIDDADFVACYIILYVSQRYPNGFVCGRLNVPCVPSMDEDQLTTTTNANELSVLFPEAYLRKKVGSHWNVWLLMNRFNLKHIPSFVNTCLVHWKLGKRPLLLMTRVPTPMEVLLQQAEGMRVVTAFVELEQLQSTHKSLLSYMEGNVEHERDSLEFVVHDLKHMTHFAAAESHDEQGE
jgi:hypothetical protein